MLHIASLSAWLVIAVTVVAISGAVTATDSDAAEVDWLVASPNETAHVRTDVCWEDGLCGVELRNGLISRRFVTSPTWGTVDFLLNATRARGGLQSMLRAVGNEGSININGTTYAVGALGQNGTFLAYLNRTSLNLTADPSGFVFSHIVVSKPTAPFPWTPGTRHSPTQAVWPPSGVRLEAVFIPPSTAIKRANGTVAPLPPSVCVSLIYDLYDGLPLLTTQMTAGYPPNATPASTAPLLVQGATVTRLALIPPFGNYNTSGSLPPGEDGEGSPNVVVPAPLVQAKTDQAHGAACVWTSDIANSYNPNCNCQDEGAVEPVLSCQASSVGTYLQLGNANYTSFRALLLVNDATDLDRQSLGRHRVTQTLAPHTMENPVFFHATSVVGQGFRTTVDRMVDVGFEMLIFSFGSGFNLENADPAYIAAVATQVAYARAKGVEVGGYDLISLDRSDLPAAMRQIDATGKVRGNSCFASAWYDKLSSLAFNFLNATGMSMLETDGPYGGGDCYATNHSHHTGHADSVGAQTALQNAFYHRLRAVGAFVNQPDNYFFQGGSKTGMGYNEFQYSLPRWKDLSVSRAGMYDDLYMHLPTQGWMFVPLADYHSGGPEASFAGHAAEYEFALSQYLGAGVAACYRGEVPYWDDESRAIATKWIAFYKRHRATLIQPVVHIRRPSMQSWDGFLHVNPRQWTTAAQEALPSVAERNAAAAEVGLAMIFNPTDRAINTTVFLPLYYTGLADTAEIVVDEDAGGQPTVVNLDRGYGVSVTLAMPPKSAHTVVIRTPPAL